MPPTTLPRTDLVPYVVRHGRGTPMFVLHGGPGMDHSYLRPGLDALGERVELIYYDQLGNGRSPEPEDWSTVEHDTWVAELEALRERLGLDRVLLFGTSYGGFLAQEYALRHPERVPGLVLCCTSPALDFGERVVANAHARGTPEQVAAVLALLGTPVPDDATFRSLAQTILPLYFHRPTPRLLQHFAAVRYRAAPFNRGFHHCVAGFDTRPELPRLAVPTLVLAGRDDWIMPVDCSAARLAAALPNAELAVFERSGHFPFLEEPAEFARVVSDWLARTL